VTDHASDTTGDSLGFADLLSALSVVPDLGMGRVPGKAVRACLVAGLARHLGLDEAAVGDRLLHEPATVNSSKRMRTKTRMPPSPESQTKRPEASKRPGASSDVGETKSGIMNLVAGSKYGVLALVLFAVVCGVNYGDLSGQGTIAYAESNAEIDCPYPPFTIPTWVNDTDGDGTGVGDPDEWYCSFDPHSVPTTTPPTTQPPPPPPPNPRVGLVDPGQGRWYLGSRDSAAAFYAAAFYFGNPGDVPMVGDWDCNGSDTPGMYRQSDGYVYLRNSNTQGTADIRFFFGDPGDVPLAGDFNGDGCDTVSIYRPSEGRFYIINRLGTDGGGLGAASVSYLFGNPGDKAFIGDFNGDGIDTVGLHRETTGLVYFRQSHTQGVADSQFYFGDPGDRIVAGDWNSDGTDTPGILRPRDTRMYLRYHNSQGVADQEFPIAEATWMPVAGDFR
jgi:hypothetical protein